MVQHLNDVVSVLEIGIANLDSETLCCDKIAPGLKTRE